VVNHEALASVLAGRSIKLEPWLFSYRCGEATAQETPKKRLMEDTLWSKNVAMNHLIKPRIVRRRFANTAYWNDN
jgi:hypothetical protein